MKKFIITPNRAVSSSVPVRRSVVTWRVEGDETVASWGTRHSRAISWRRADAAHELIAGSKKRYLLHTAQTHIMGWRIHFVALALTAARVPFFARLWLRRNLGLTPSREAYRCLLGLWMPFLWAFLFWLWAVWFFDFAILSLSSMQIILNNYQKLIDLYNQKFLQIQNYFFQ